MKAVLLPTLMTLGMAISAGADTPSATPEPDVPARVKQLSKEVLAGLVTAEGVGSRLCSGTPALQERCLKWKEQILAIAQTETDWSRIDPAVERDLIMLADMVVNGWADDAARQDAFIDELTMTPVMSVAEYGMARQNLNRLRTEAYEVKVPALNGGEIDLARLRGKPVIVTFWSMGCVGCRQQIPKLKALYEKYHGEGLEIVGMPSDKDQQKLKGFLARENMAWPQAADRERARADFEAFGFRWVSNVLLLDKNGRLLRCQPSFDLEQWEALIRAELGLEALART